jgi:hypothetical protein
MRTSSTRHQIAYTSVILVRRDVTQSNTMKRSYFRGAFVEHGALNGAHWYQKDPNMSKCREGEEFHDTGQKPETREELLDLKCANARLRAVLLVWP